MLNDLNRGVDILIIAPMNGVSSVHFTGLNKLKGIDSDLWIPLPVFSSLFESVEKVMQINRVCHNLVSMRKIRTCGESSDYEVIFNKPTA